MSSSRHSFLRCGIATRRGDDGHTSTVFGQRIPKHHPLIEALGALDELSVALGLARLHLSGPDDDILERIQFALIRLMGEVAASQPHTVTDEDLATLSSADLQQIDDRLDELEATNPFTGWAIPGQGPASTFLHQARTTARRAERRLSALADIGCHSRPVVSQYINRLSDLLWLMANAAAASPGSGK